MAINITQIGVDKPSGSPLITRSNYFEFNEDLESKTDIFYYLGTNLNSSSWVNPGDTEFLEANKIQSNGNVVLGSGKPIVDNKPNTSFLTNESNSNVGAELKFKRGSFKISTILLNGSPDGWVLSGSNDNGNNYNTITFTKEANLGGGWYKYNVNTSSYYPLYRFTHGQQGVSKSLNCLRLYGTYNTGDFAPSVEDNTLILNCRNLEGDVFLPDANNQSFPEDFYFEVFNLYDNNYTIKSISGSTTTVVDNTNNPLTKGDKYIFVYNSSQWNVFKVGAIPNLGTKGALLSQDGLEPVIVPPGVSGQALVRDDAAVSGLNWVNLSINNQLFNPVVTSNFTLDNSFNNKMIPIDTSGGDIVLTLGTKLQPGFQIIIYHYGGGKVTIAPNGQVYRARGNTILNSNAAITLSFDLATNTWYGIGDLVQE